MKEKEGSDVLSASLSRNIERISIPASLSFSLYLGDGTIPKLLIKGKAMFPFYLNAKTISDAWFPLVSIGRPFFMFLC